jgi:hypothetical protein
VTIFKLSYLSPVQETLAGNDRRSSPVDIPDPMPHTGHHPRERFNGLLVLCEPAPLGGRARTGGFTIELDDIDFVMTEVRSPGGRSA